MITIKVATSVSSRNAMKKDNQQFTSEGLGALPKKRKFTFRNPKNTFSEHFHHFQKHCPVN
jgi:hypothetical protein